MNEYVSVYFALMGDGHGRIGFRIDITEKDNKKKELMNKLNRRARSEMNPIELAELEAEIKQIKHEKYLKLVQLANGRNHITENKDVSRFDPSVARNLRAMKKDKKLEIMENTAMRRLNLEFQDRERKRMNFIGSEFAKVLRVYIHEQEQIREEKAEWSRKWIKAIFIDKVCQEIVATIKREKAKLEARKRMSANIAAFKTATKIRLRMKGESLEARMLHEARLYKNVYHVIIKGIAIFVIKFLKATKPVYFLHKSFMSMVSTSQRVQRAWRIYKRKKNEYRIAMNDVWERYYMTVFNDPATKALVENSTIKLPPEDLKNDEIAKRSFMKELFAASVKRYLLNYHFLRLDTINQSPDVKKKQMVTKKWLSIGQKKQQEINLLERQQSMHPSRKKKKENLMEQYQDEPDSPLKTSSLATLKLFVLPPMTELFDLIRAEIVHQKNAKYL